MNRIFTSIALVFISTYLFGQSQWKFPIYFQDGSGARDTIWYIWDSAATGQIDTLLGEGKVNMNTGSFNVFITDFNIDSTKTVALPFSFSSISTEVKAINIIYPVTISWDTSLFNHTFPIGLDTINGAFLSNQYFYFVNNDPGLQAYNMLIDNQVDCVPFSWGSQSHFPMLIVVVRDTSFGVGIQNINLENKIMIIPNPSDRLFTIYSEKNIEYFEVRNLNYEILRKGFVDSNVDQFDINLDGFVNGIYLLTFITTNKSICHEKIIKISSD